MNNTENNKSKVSLPLARVFRLKELSGLIGKHMFVPAGRTGVVILPNGTVRNYKPGYHHILSAFERLIGRGSGLLAGYVPVEAFNASVKLGYLLSGDQVLLDGQIICMVEVCDPPRFLREVVAPQRTIWSTVELDPTAIEKALAPVLSLYAASDIIQGKIDSRISTAAQNSLPSTLDPKGLSLQRVSLVSITRAEDRAVIAEKAQAIAERLRDAALQKKMVEIESQSQLEDFVHQLDPDLAKRVHLSLGEEEPEKGKLSIKDALTGALTSWFKADNGKEGAKRRWSLERLFKRKSDESPLVDKPRRVPSKWWLPRALWIFVVLLLGWGLTAFVNWIAGAASWDNKIEVLLIIWAFVIGAVLESIKALYEKGEAISEQSWTLPGFQHLDNLVGNDRQKVDKLVREQCSQNLIHIREVLSEIRSREYKRGKTELSLKLRNQVEANLEDCTEKIQHPDYGRPTYVTDLHISRHAWGDMLDKDEDLLLYANALSESAHLLQQKSHADQMTNEMVAELDADVLQLCNKFYERGRVLQMHPEKTRK